MYLDLHFSSLLSPFPEKNCSWPLIMRKARYVAFTQAYSRIQLKKSEGPTQMTEARKPIFFEGGVHWPSGLWRQSGVRTRWKCHRLLKLYPIIVQHPTLSAWLMKKSSHAETQKRQKFRGRWIQGTYFSSHMGQAIQTAEKLCLPSSCYILSK